MYTIVLYALCSTNKIQLSSNEEKQLFVDDFYTIHTIQYTGIFVVFDIRTSEPVEYFSPHIFPTCFPTYFPEIFSRHIFPLYFPHIFPPHVFVPQHLTAIASRDFKQIQRAKDQKKREKFIFEN